MRGIRTLARCNTSTPLAGAPLEPLGYHRMSRLSMDIRLSINCLSE
nr:MAG TPA: hypothetical protein [Caudoviricetes sp.]